MDRIGRTTAAHPMAFLSDVHGNLPALQAVLAELRRLAVVDVFVAGDLLLGGEQPLEVWQRLQELKARCTRGPSDLALSRVDPGTLRPTGAAEEASARRFRETRAALGEVILRRLAELPLSMRIPMLDGRELVMLHGSPKDPFSSISHELEDDEILELLDDDPADIVICGGSHVPFLRQVEGVDVVNVGSVGEAPEGGVAHYTVVYPKVDGATIDQSWVEF